jgi:hypothetical protein
VRENVNIVAKNSRDDENKMGKEDAFLVLSVIAK